MPGEQVFLGGGGTASSQAQGAPGAEIDQVGEPFGAGPGDLAGLRVRAVGGGAAAELINPGGLDRLLLLVQVSELLIGVGGEGAGGGAVRDAVAAGRGEAGIRSSPTASPSRVRSREVSRARCLTAGSHSVKVPCSQPGVPQRHRVLDQSSRTRRSPMNTSRGAVRGCSLTRVAALPHRGQQRGASKAGSVITSTRVCPSPVTVTAVTSSPGIPSRTVAAAQAGAQAARVARARRSR